MSDPVEIGGTADRSNEAERRRDALVGVAVVVVLALVVGAGVLVARSGEESDSGASAEPGETLLLPPVDAEILTAGVVGRTPEGVYSEMSVDSPIAELATYHVVFVGDDGTRYGFSVSRWPLDRSERTMGTAYSDDPSAPVTATDARGLVTELGFDRDLPRIDVTVASLDSAIVTCFGRAPGADGAHATQGPPGVFGVIGQRWIVTLAPVEEHPLQACDTESSAPLVDIANRLRPVGEDEWRAFMERWLLQGGTSSATAPPAPATTEVIQGVSIPNEDEARAAVVAVFEGLDHQAADGTYPNVETGDDVAFWQPFFEEAAATPQITEPGGFTVDDVAFLSEDRAHVQFQAHAKNGDQEIHVTRTGEAVRIGDRWYVSRETMVQLLNGAVSGDRRR